MRLLTTRFGNAQFIQAQPDENDIVVHASAEFDTLDGTRLHEVWPDIVRATHPDFSAYFPDVRIDQSTFLPIDLERFLAIRCRAVSGLERWGPNVNGDGFPCDQLIQTCRTLMAKGFYVEHQSFDPANAVGIIAHAEWVDDQQYVDAVALVDKVRHAALSDHIRDMLRTKRGGVSIGCIAGEAECSICGNVARRKDQLCAHMNRGNPGFIKGRRVPLSRITGNRHLRRYAWEQEDGHRLAYDICRRLYFYELSYTKAPADKDALSHFVRGSVLRYVAEDKDGQAVAEVDAPAPDPAWLDKAVDRAVHDAFMTRYRKLVKDEVYRKMEEDIKKGLVKVRPMVQEIVDEKRAEVKEGVLPTPVGATK